jgi:hypothetical protein
MKSAVLEDFELTPVKGDANAFIIHPKSKPHPAKEKTTVEDWNKFEKDIADAFEKIP